MKRLWEIDLLQHLQVDVLEMDEHARVVQLKLNHAPLEAFVLGQMFGELGGKLAVDGKLELVALNQHMNLVPSILVDVILGHGSLYLGQGGFVVLIDHQPFAPETAMLPASGRMEIPCPKNLRANAEMTDVCMITLETAFPRRIDDGSNAHSTVSLAGKAIGKFQFEIGHFLVSVHNVTAGLGPVADDHAVLDRPSRGCLGRHSFPTIECFSVENLDEFLVGLGESKLGGKKEGEGEWNNSGAHDVWFYLGMSAESGPFRPKCLARDKRPPPR